MHPDYIMKPEHARYAAFMRELASTKAQNQDYLAYGEMVSKEVVNGPVSLLKTEWCMWNPDADFAVQPLMDIETPAVQATAWRHSEADRYGIFFVNMSEESEEVAWCLELRDPSSFNCIDQSSEAGCAVDECEDGLCGRIEVPALSTKVLELVKTEGNG